MKRCISILVLALITLMLCIPALAENEREFTSDSMGISVRSIDVPVKPEETEGNDITVTYEPGDGTGTAYDDGAYAKGTVITIKHPDALGFTAPTDAEGKPKGFAGWKWGTGTIQAGSTLSKLTENITLTAIWVEGKKETVATVTYHENTSKERKKTVEYKEGEQITLPDTFWSHKSKNFLGWATSSEATKPDYKAGTEVVVTDKKNNLYGVWQTNGPDLSIYAWITNKKWDKDGCLVKFRPGEEVHFHIVVTNTGSETLKKIVVYNTLKGAKMHKGSGYSLDDDRNAIVRNLGVGQSVVIKGRYTVKSSDQSKRRVVNSAYAYYAGGEKWDAFRIPVHHYYTTTVEEKKTTDITVYADSELALALNRVRAAYENANPDNIVTIVYGDSEEFSRQIASRGGSDVFITAGDGPMDVIDIWEGSDTNPNRVDRIVSSTRIQVMENRAVLAGRFGTVANFRQLEQVLSSGQARLAVSKANDPAGVLAAEIIHSLGLDASTLRATGAIVECASAEEVTSAVITGAADLGILTGAMAQNAGLTAADTASDALCSAVNYPAAILRGSRQQESAQKFLDYLRSSEARSILRDLGYTIQ